MVVVLVVEVLTHKTFLAIQFGVVEVAVILGMVPLGVAMVENLFMVVLVVVEGEVITLYKLVLLAQLLQTLEELLGLEKLVLAVMVVKALVEYTVVLVVGEELERLLALVVLEEMG